MLMICTFPPPVHGQSLVHQYLRDEFSRSLPQLDVCDISPSDHAGLAYHATRMQRVSRALYRLWAGDEEIVYLSSESGFGVIYSIALFSMARLRKKNTFLHHHVYSHISEPGILHRLMMRVSGPRCTHIALSEQMARELRQRYPAVDRCMLLHNAVFVRPNKVAIANRREKADGLTVGFIGRLDDEKGFDDVLALMTHFAADERVRFVVAGDEGSSTYGKELAQWRRRLGDRLDLRGFVNGDRKTRFFHDVDVLVFPSKYRHEASPMVCYEALAAAVPVLVSRVGAVTDIVDDSCGAVFERGPDLVARLAARLECYTMEPDLLTDQQWGAWSRFRDLHRRASMEMEELCRRLDGDVEVPTAA